MKEFFRGWKRKCGVISLVMACLLMAGWVRSYSANDVLGPCGMPLESIGIFGVGLESSDGILQLSYLTMIEGIANLSVVVFLNCPYSSIVIPLTLISAFLLLSKPRKTTPKKIPEPILAEGK